MGLKELLEVPGSCGVCRIDEVDLRLDAEMRWSYAYDNRAAIDEHWTTRLKDNPAFFNGKVMMLTDASHDGEKLVGTFLKTDFKSFLYWRDKGSRDACVRDAFGSALVFSSDGALMLVRQSPGQVNTGLTYFPGGFIDERDVRENGQIDIVGSVVRELKEETGLGSETVEREPGFVLTFNEAQLSFGVTFRSVMTAEQLHQSVKGFIERDPSSELADVIFLSRAELRDGGTFARFAQIAAEYLLGR